MYISDREVYSRFQHEVIDMTLDDDHDHDIQCNHSTPDIKEPESWCVMPCTLQCWNVAVVYTAVTNLGLLHALCKSTMLQCAVS